MCMYVYIYKRVIKRGVKEKREKERGSVALRSHAFHSVMAAGDSDVSFVLF